MTDRMTIVPLIAHPSTASPHVRGMTVHVGSVGSDVLRLRYRIEGDVAQLRLPARAAPAFNDGLWKHTCFECFAKAADALPYVELNFSPSGEWAAYRFDDYRQGMAPLAASK